jgi:serine/threonine-protein kinase HipA
VEALALNWVIVGSDAHAKNYSLLLAPGGEVRLAPLYDVITVLPYDQYYPPRTKLAMRIGGEYRAGYILRRHWERLAREAELQEEDVLGAVHRICEGVAATVTKVCDNARQAGLERKTIATFEEAIREQLPLRIAALEGDNDARPARSSSEGG